VVAVGTNENRQLAVSSWKDVTQIAAGVSHTVGLKDNGMVVAVGNNYYGQSDIGNWTDIIQVATGGYRTVGLKADGTVIAAGSEAGGQYVINSWADITQISTGEYQTVGLKADGTVVAACPDVELAKWNLGVVEYTLTISTTGNGSLTTPGEGVFTYNAGVIVHLSAEPDDGYKFVSWTGDIDNIFDLNDAATVITMKEDYNITANFASGNWPLIGGIIAAAVVAAGLAIFLVRRRRSARTKKHDRRKITRKKH